MADTSKQDVEFLEQFEPDVFWQQHGKKIMAGVAVVVLIGLGAYYWQREMAAQEEAAAAKLADARDPVALRQLVQDYRGKELAAQALLRIADLELQNGQHKEAGEAFQQFLSEFPNHSVAESARLGLAVAQEAQGSFEAAKQQYEQVLTASPSGYTSIAARLGLARCAEGLGLTKEAAQAYEELRPMVQGLPVETEVLLRSTVLERNREMTDTNPAPSNITLTPVAPTAVPPPQNP